MRGKKKTGVRRPLMTLEDDKGGKMEMDLSGGRARRTRDMIATPASHSKGEKGARGLLKKNLDGTTVKLAQGRNLHNTKENRERFARKKKGEKKKSA